MRLFRAIVRRAPVFRAETSVLPSVATDSTAYASLSLPGSLSKSIPKVPGDFWPCLIECLTHSLHSFGAERGSANQSIRFHPQFLSPKLREQSVVDSTHRSGESLF
jgi:hypothetical protein